MQAEISSDFKFCDLNHKILKYKGRRLLWQHHYHGIKKSVLRKKSVICRLDLGYVFWWLRLYAYHLCAFGYSKDSPWAPRKHLHYYLQRSSRPLGGAIFGSLPINMVVVWRWLFPLSRIPLAHSCAVYPPVIFGFSSSVWLSVWGWRVEYACSSSYAIES